MKVTKKTFSLFCLSTFCCLILGCHPGNNKQPLFTVLDRERTGLDFVNKLHPTPAFNMFKYMYFYNGAGIGAGDFNKDGKVDLFFSANQGQNKLYLNKGNLHFTDITKEARIPQDGGWSTGVSVVDINNDGLLDIYVCKVGNYEVLKSKNQLLVCQGITKSGVPYYVDKAKEYGLDFSGFSTQAAFIDYDVDGDLDLFLLNHSVHQNGKFARRSDFLGTYDALSGDRLYRNDGNRFTDVSRQAGIHSSAISYGLGIVVSDIDLDGYPDIYIGNDFHENDYLYINQHNGSFKDELTARTMHSSQFSMGVDAADINNDGWPEIISLDMLPADPYILKRSLGEDEYYIFNLKIGYGYNYQYTRNNLQWNRGNGLFSEVGLYSGVAATDWSWAPLWMDFDNDGLKDLFISNGIPKRMNDIDYVNYVSNEEVQQKINNNKMGETDMALIDKFPEIKLANKFFKNQGNLAFADQQDKIEHDAATFSNGAVYADLDNDGDLDIVVNNVDDPVLVYENRSDDLHTKKYLELELKGPSRNINAIGAKAIVFARDQIRMYEKYAVRGFQSSMEIPLHIGLDNTQVDSIILVWPDHTYQKINWTDSFKAIAYNPGLPLFDYKRLTTRFTDTIRPMEYITKAVNLNFVHEENPFVEFDREPLIPFMVSKEGPGLAVGDANNDGREDIFIGSSKFNKSAVFFQTAEGRFQKIAQPSLDADSTCEDVDACWVDVNNDKRVDLVVASGGNEYYGKDERLSPRVYLNNGRNQFIKKEDAFKDVYLTASCVVPYDFNKDGAIDLFVGGRAVPWEYGQVPQSYLLQNDGTGRYKDVAGQYNKELSYIGFVKDAKWVDLDRDGADDLLLSLEWGGIYAFMNKKDHFEKKALTEKKGWWNFALPCDVDGDGDLDLICGNQGLNTRLRPTEKEPVRLYYNDFDNNGKKEQVLTYCLAGKEIPFANKDELQRQIPEIKKRFLYAADFARASLTEILTPEKLKNAQLQIADYFSNALLINDGHLNFHLQALPWKAQLTPFKDAVVVNANNDSLPDILLVGNFYENNIQMGRYDADYGTILINAGRGRFRCSAINGLSIKGQVRHIHTISVNKREAYILAKNNDTTQVISFSNKYQFQFGSSPFRRIHKIGARPRAGH